MNPKDMERLRAWFETCTAHKPASGKTKFYPCAFTAADPSKETDCSKCQDLLKELETQAYGSS